MAALTATDAGWQSHTAIQQNCCTCHLPQIKKRAESERASGEARRRKLFIPAACKMDMQSWQTAASWEAPPPLANGVACGKWKMMPSRREMHLPNELATSSGNVEETSHWISYSAWKVNMLYRVDPSFSSLHSLHSLHPLCLVFIATIIILCNINVIFTFSTNCKCFHWRFFYVL